MHRSLLLMILLPVSRLVHFIDVEQGGFIAITILQLGASYVLYLALHHEAQFRSSGIIMYIYYYIIAGNLGEVFDLVIW